MQATERDTRNRNSALRELIRPLPVAAWAADYPLSDLERALARFGEYEKLNLAPDFQRGHVWKSEQQIAFIEALIRRALPSSGLLIQWNCPSWAGRYYEGELPQEIQIVDGLQRLTAVRLFLKDELPAFGLPKSAFDDTEFSMGRGFLYSLRFAVHTFKTRAELLNFYLAINSGGTPHTPEEIARVQSLLTTASER